MTASPSIPVEVTVAPGGSLPEYATTGAAGADVRCLEGFTLEPGARLLAPTGLRVAVPEGYELQVRPRSGLAFKHGITMANAPGTIDSDYRGEVGVILINHGAEAVTFAAGDRIGQLVLAPVCRIAWVAVERLDDSARGEGGFGSTGR